MKTRMQTALPTLASMNRLQSLWLGDYKCFYNVCRDLLPCTSFLFASKHVLYRPIFPQLLFLSFPFPEDFLFFLHFFHELQLFKVGLFFVPIQANEISAFISRCTLKLQIAWFLFHFSFLFSLSRGIFKQTPG